MSTEQRTLPDVDDSSRPSWHHDALQSVTKLVSLQNNWDGYRSPPIDPLAVCKSIALLDAIKNYEMPAPEVCPVSGGGIGIAWRLHNRELEIEILPDGSAEYLTVEGEEGQKRTVEGSLPPNPTSAMQRVATWLING